MPIQHTVVFRLIHPAGSAEEREFLKELIAEKKLGTGN